MATLVSRATMLLSVIPITRIFPAINGNRSQANNYTLDGIDINEPENNLIGYNLAPDALQEIKYSIDVAAHDMATPSSLETNINFHCHHLPRSNRDKRSTLGVLSGTGCRRH
jgi:hypothetical protein